jgi:hypothetical protein
MKEREIKIVVGWNQWKNWVIDGCLLNLTKSFLGNSISNVTCFRDVIVDLLKEVES